MKANEAPEKIFLHPDIGGREFIRPWLKTRASQESVEYTRTDAFIEKAYEYLNKTCRGFILTEKDIEDFKNYMKGE